MAGRIPREFIDDLIARSDIVDIVDNRVRLKKAGKNYQACCPFHNEKSPSFTVSQDKQFYHCFGCGAHGNVISFLMEYDRLEFVEAIEELAKLHGIDVPREQGAPPAASAQQKQQREDDYALMEKACRYFQQQLRQHPNSEQVITYLKKRGLSGEIVKQWDIGYAPTEWDGLLKTLGSTSTAVEQLLALQLVKQNDQGRKYDFFRDRVMFAIRDKRGRVVGFGGRIISGDGPKYLNSPETRIFHKGSELYGLYQTRQQNRKVESVIIVEGYMDVVALNQYGITNVVAALGTATTEQHMQQLLRTTDTVICCYDGDRAGRDAAWRALENALPVLQDGSQLKFLFLPDGEDPDSMVRKIGKEAFLAQLAQSQTLTQFFFATLLDQHKVGTPEGKLALKAAVQPLVDKIKADGQRQLLLEQLAQVTGEHDRFKYKQDVAKANQTKAPQKYQQERGQPKSKISPIRSLLLLLLEFPWLASQQPTVTPDILMDSGLRGIELLIELHRYCQQHPNATTAHVLEHFRDHVQFPAISKLLQQENLIHRDDAIPVYIDSFNRLLDWQLDSRMDYLMARAHSGVISAEEKEELALLVTSRR